MSLQEVLTDLERRLAKYETGINEIRKALAYLKQYGYIESITSLKIGDIFSAVRAFQQLASIVVDGEIGPKTIGAMEWPRCGRPDNMQSLKLEKGSWGVKNLNFYVEDRDSDLSASDWDNTMQQAFDQWSDVANLKFTQVQSAIEAHFVLSVGSGPSDNFDGPSGTLAWAYLPPYDGYIGTLNSKFDSAETWRLNSSQNGILLLPVACHEFGHLLGLEHSNIGGALMAPFYNPAITKPQANDDISRIQTKYGPPVVVPPTPDPEPTPIPAPTELDAVYMGDRNVKLSWKDNSTGEDGFAVERNEVWIGTVGRGVTGGTDTNVPDGVHTYRVKTVFNNEHSAWSNEAVVYINVQAPEPPPPPPPEPEPEPEPEPPPAPEEVEVTIITNVENIKVPGYRLTKL